MGATAPLSTALSTGTGVLDSLSQAKDAKHQLRRAENHAGEDLLFQQYGLMQAQKERARARRENLSTQQAHERASAAGRGLIGSASSTAKLAGDLKEYRREQGADRRETSLAMTRNLQLHNRSLLDLADQRRRVGMGLKSNLTRTATSLLGRL